MSTNNLKLSNNTSTLNNNRDDFKNTISNFINDISNSLTLEDISSSIETLEKIGPYLPSPYVSKVNSLVFNFEKIKRANELISFMSKEPPQNLDVNVQDISSKEKFNKILLTLKDDIPQEKIKNIRPIIDIVANFDKYKGMLSMISIMNNQSEKSEDKIENMMNMMLPILGQNEESSNKMKDILEIFKNIASSPSNNDSREDNISEEDFNEEI